MHIVLYPRVPTSEERKKERERERERDISTFVIIVERRNPQNSPIQKNAPSFFFQVKRSLCRINKTRFYTHARKRTHARDRLVDEIDRHRFWNFFFGLLVSSLWSARTRRGTLFKARVQNSLTQRVFAGSRLAKGRNARRVPMCAFPSGFP